MRVSVIVPTKNADRTIEACLESIQRQTHGNLETVVVDNSSVDDTPVVAARLADIVLNAGPERSAQRNRGAQVATGDVLLFIDADMVLEPQVAADIVAAFAADDQVGALVVGERSFGEGFLAACRVREKALYVGDDDVEAPRAFRREAFWRVGAWDESLTAAEDWDLADRTRDHGVRIGRVASWIWHDEGRIELRQQYRKKRYYGRWVAEYVRRHPEGSRHMSRTTTLRRARTLLTDPRHAAGLVALKSVEAAGLLAGMRGAA